MLVFFVVVGLKSYTRYNATGHEYFHAYLNYSVKVVGDSRPHSVPCVTVYSVKRMISKGDVC